MSALPSSAFKVDVRLERKMRYEFAKLKAKGQLRSLYHNQYAKPVAGQTTTVSIDSRGSLGIDERAVHLHTYWWEAHWGAS